MGEVATETVREIEQTRKRIESNIHQLEERLPAPGAIVRKARAVAIGGGAGGTVAVFIVKRILKSRAKKKAAASRPVVNIMPRQWVEIFGDDESKAMFAGVAALWIAFRLIEIRQMRKLRLARAM